MNKSYLTVLGHPYHKTYGNRNRLTVDVKCVCGKRYSILKQSLDNVTSCGCKHAEWNRTYLRNHNTKHGMTRKRLYAMWCNMKNRCYNKNVNCYHNYGGRGITVCAKWRDAFEPFMEWALANGYTDDLTIDRKNNNEGYSPDNCRFITAQDQSHNLRKNINVTAFGETKIIADWVRDERCALTTPDGILYRLNTGMSPEDAITTPRRR